MNMFNVKSFESSKSSANQCYKEELIKNMVDEFRLIIDEVYHSTPLELCGPLLDLDERIVERFLSK